MSSPIHRRTFLNCCQAGAVAAAVAPTRLGQAASPVQRNGKPLFKFSLAAYSYRELLSGTVDGIASGS